MNTRTHCAAACIVLAGGSVALSTATAHHTAAAFYDSSLTVSIQGTVTGVRLANPHSYFRVTTSDGEDWAFESAAAGTALRRAGWSEDTIPIGARVRMSGAPSRDGDTIARYSSILVEAEGTDAVELYFGGANDWGDRARDLGGPCPSGIEACVALSAEAIAVLQAEFGNIGVWSEYSQ